jgi:hypothetical protein
MDRVAYVDNQLSTFKDSLTLYQEQKNWYAKLPTKAVGQQGTQSGV